jgi:SPP1 gp7 family putative phage head morphogenesis protein
MTYLRNNRLRIEKFVYEKGTNVALYNAEHDNRYQSFQENLEKALYSQILRIADYKDKLPLLMSLAKAKTNASEQLINQVSVLINTDSLQGKIDLAAYLIWAGEQGGQAFFDKTNIDGIFGLKDEDLISYFNDYSNLIIESVDDYTKQWIATKIQDGKLAGLSPFEIQTMLEEDGKAMSSIRAERIVLTETAKAMTKVELEAARRNGILEKIWRTSLDERVCPTCSPLEGQRRKIDEDFSEGIDGPPAHVSCRCYFEEVIPDGWQMPDNVWQGQ